MLLKAYWWIIPEKIWLSEALRLLDNSIKKILWGMFSRTSEKRCIKWRVVSSSSWTEPKRLRDTCTSAEDKDGSFLQPSPI